MTEGTIYQHLDGKPLFDFYQVEIKQDEDTKRVVFHSRIHVNKANEVPFCWSADFTNYQILRDSGLITWVINHYGNVWA